MTRSEWLAKAEEVERKIDALLEAGEEGGSSLEYVHAKAEACRFLAVNTPEENSPPRRTGGPKARPPGTVPEAFL